MRALLILALLTSRSALAADLELDRWLSRPGVKLVAVEFYATWCAPCMEAVPRWKALHEKHRKDGLRLVVVATQDPEGDCSNPGWNPDEIICDADGALAARFGASKLPAAFLWSWQGERLVSHGHADEVERQVIDWLASAPRVDVEVKRLDPKAGIGKTELAELVRTKLRDDDKLVVIATEAERKRLLEIKKRSFRANQRDDQQCELGMELSANSSLDVAVWGEGARQRLQLNLLSAEKGCLVAGAVVDWDAGKPRVAVAEAVAELIAKLSRREEKPPPPPANMVERTRALDVKFRAGTDAIGKLSFAALDELARELLADQSIRIRIEAHTDSRGAEDFNKTLTQRRAEAIKTYLVRKNVAASRIDAIGYGEERPISSNLTAQGRRANRRIDAVILAPR